VLAPVFNQQNQVPVVVVLVKELATMTDHPPAPPNELSDTIVTTLDEYSSDHLRAVAQYAEALAEHRDRAARLAEDDEEREEIEERPEDLPDDVPGKATVTTKTINDNRYDYWQWREGDQIKSQYKGPASPDE
jgi:hypothetical protein